MLPDPKGELAAVVPPQIIIAANNQVRTTKGKQTKRGPYKIIVNGTEQAKIGKYVSLHGVTATVKHFEDQDLKIAPYRTGRTFLNRSTGESARRLKKPWLKQMRM